MSASFTSSEGKAAGNRSAGSGGGWKRWLPRTAAALAAVSLAGCGFSEMQQLDERAGATWSDIEVQLLRRAELVPSLVATVERYAAAPPSTFEAVSDSRVELAAAVRSGSLSAMRAASAALSDALDELLAAAADNVELQADPSFRRLVSDIATSEEEILRAGRSYNEAVRRYNEYISAFPQIITAKVIGAEKRELFSVPDSPDSPSPVDE